MKINWTKVLESLAVCGGYPLALHRHYASIPREHPEPDHHDMTPITSAYIEQRFMPQLIATNDPTGCLDAMSSDAIARAFTATFG